MGVGNWQCRPDKQNAIAPRVTKGQSHCSEGQRPRYGNEVYVKLFGVAWVQGSRLTADP
ncbi:MAG: hypothetical protein F6K65_05010 [Moorea sp. SIO3C2]|nr:hypothetical protein [Moorena sp. SIO3C2]